MEGFFHKSELISAKPRSRVALCGKCKLNEHCDNPYVPVLGEGRLGILILTEAPSFHDDGAHRFLSKWDSDKPFEKAMEACGLDVERDCWVSASVICAPYDTKLDSKYVNYCRPNIFKLIKELQPRVIICMGSLPVQSVIAESWTDKFGDWERWIGWQIPDRFHNAWICPTYAPGWIHAVGHRYKTVQKAFTRHIRNAIKLSKKPIPEKLLTRDYEKEVTIIENPDDAAKELKRLQKLALKYDWPTSFDYETNSISPYYDQSAILSCAICYNGTDTISYPMIGEPVGLTRKYLRSPLRKIACNLSFEEQWSSMKFGTRVRNWWWDTMLGAHWEKCTKGITSIKFQSYVRLGMATYNSKVETLMKGDGRFNRLATEVSLPTLLRYNGVDSLLEYIVCMDQRRKGKLP